MARHDVKFSVPGRPLGKADIDFDVMADNAKLGTLRVSKGSLVWYRTKGQKGLKISWAKFGELMGEHGRPAERRSRNA